MDGISKDNFLNSVTIQDVILGRLEIIGEAARNLPDTFKQQHLEVAWYKIIGLRNVLSHEYFGIDLDLVWEVVNTHLPIFKQQVKEMLEADSVK
ncbi:MAG: HepT-like ribonuclease domain-containing protein [bacterium]